MSVFRPDNLCVREIARVSGHYAVQSFKVTDFGAIESRMRLAISEYTTVQ